MSAITYQNLPSKLPTPAIPQIANQTSWGNWKPLNSQLELFRNLGKIMCFCGVGFFVAEIFNNTSPEKQVVPHEESVYAYFVTCEQVANAFLTAALATAFCSIGVFGYFLKSTQERCNKGITPEMKAAIQNQVEKAIQIHLERQQER
ncbi:MAG: hypothetical protein ACRDAI_06960 [Candidatus Rhabdochlamydia sp.]